MQKNLLDNVQDLNETLSQKKKKYKITTKIEVNRNLKVQKIYIMIIHQVLFLLVTEKIINLREWAQSCN